MKTALIFEEEEAIKALEAMIQKAVNSAVEELREADRQREKEEDQWVDGPEAMRILGIKAKSTLQDLRDVNAFTFSQPTKKVIRYYKPSLIKYLEDHIVKY